MFITQMNQVKVLSPAEILKQYSNPEAKVPKTPKNVKSKMSKAERAAIDKFLKCETSKIIVSKKIAKPRKNEITFRNNKYSVFNVGGQAAKLGSRKIKF